TGDFREDFLAFETGNCLASSRVGHFQDRLSPGDAHVRVYEERVDERRSPAMARETLTPPLTEIHQPAGLNGRLAGYLLDPRQKESQPADPVPIRANSLKAIVILALM